MQIFDKSKFIEHYIKIKQRFNLKDCYLHSFAANIAVDELAIIERNFSNVLTYGIMNENFNALQFSNKTQQTPDIVDEENSNLEHDKFDLIVSNLTMQYNNDVIGALIQYNRALKKDGLFICNLLGGDTLFELKRAMLKTDMDCFGKAYSRVIPLIEIKQMGALMQRAKFDMPISTSNKVVVEYPNLKTMLFELKAMGLGNYMLDRTWSFDKLYFDKLEQNYIVQTNITGSKIEATFEILTATGSK